MSHDHLTQPHKGFSLKDKIKSSRVVLLALLLLGAGFIISTFAPAWALNAPPVQIYYVTLPETDGLTALDTINTAANAPMYTYFSIAIGVDGTYVYYDQWEDGYVGDIANPTGVQIYNSATNPAGVQVWGNGIAADGCAPNIAGVAVTCTDGNDVLNAGDVIIPYNAVPIPRVPAPQSNVLDQFSAQLYSNNNGNTNWASNWTDLDTTIVNLYRDEFGSAAFNNTNGTLDWSSQVWTEVGDDGVATTGDILITGGELQFNGGAAAGDLIWRTASGLNSYSSLSLSFDLNSNSIDGANDAIAIEVSGDGGSTWATLQQFNDDVNATFSYDVTTYKANLAVRFRMVGGLESGELWLIDNVNISAPVTSSSGPTAGTIQVTGDQLRFTAAAAGDRIDRGVNLSTGGSCATLTFNLGESGIEDGNDDRFRVEVSSDGGANYTTLETFDNDNDAGLKSYNISGHATANTRVRFIAVDALETGEYWSVDNVQVTWNCSIPVLFDGKDKIGASSSIAMARATWADGSGTLNAFAHEMYPTAEWGTAYEAPVGTNTANAGEMFQYSALSIMAAQNNTTVQIDADANGTYETVVVLQEGGATLIPNIQQGARVIADKPVQVLQVTGDIGSNYASRDMNLLPTAAWGSSYWSPVGVVNGGFNTRLFLYNLSTNGSIYITCERYGVANTTLGPIAAKGVATIDLVNGQGAHCFASTSGGVAVNSPIFAIGTVDTTNTAYDWSFTLFPDNFLTTDALVGLGLGKDPTNAGSTENGSPLWVTSTCDTGGTYVYVDWDNDGIADPVDTDGDDVAEAGSQNGILVQRLQSVRLFEPGGDAEPYDQSGARVWSRTASGVGYGGTPGCNLALAWGQDPANASPASPGLDVGTSIFPLSLIEGTKSVAFANDIAPVGVLNEGDTIYYNITVYNAGTVQVNNVFVYDTVPLNTTYVLNSTEYNMTGVNPWTPIADVGGTLPLAQPGGVLLGNLAAGQTFYVRFRVTIQPGNFEDITNCDAVSTSAGSFTNCVTVSVATRDWGDLPDSYGTSAAQNGPRHSASAIRLGTLWDVESQGAPSANANGDDIATSDDEDGVTRDLNDVWVPGATVDLNVTVTGGSGVLAGWFDWNNDGDITDAGEFYNFGTLPAGNNVVQVTIPAQYPAGASVYARFRLFATGAIPGGSLDASDYLGFAAGGEVEDHLFSVQDPRVTIEKLGPTTAKPGVPFNYTINYANTGNVQLTNVTIKDVLPHTAISDMKVLSVVSPNGVTCAPLNTINTTVTCTGLANLEPAPGPGNTGTLVLQVEVVAATNQVDNLTNTACITGDYSGGTLGLAPTICSEITTTTPVTVSYFEATPSAGGTHFEWGTASETANAGFNLYVQTPGGLELVNDQLIHSAVFDSRAPQDYSYDAPGITGNTFFIEDVGLFGENRFHGPFAAGELHGSRATPQMIDWAAIAAENEAALAQSAPATMGAQAQDQANAPQAVELRVDRDGIYRLTYEQILAATGVDFLGATRATLALTNRGEPVPLYVSKLRFGPGAYIEFIGEGLDTIYTGTNVYRLELKRGAGMRVVEQRARPTRGMLLPAVLPSYYMETATVEANNVHSAMSPNSDPWYFASLFTSAPNKTYSFGISLDNYVVGAAPGTFNMTVWGMSDWVAGPDHHLKVALNGTQIAAELFDGNELVELSIPLPGGTLKEGANQLVLTQPLDRGAIVDYTGLESYEVVYPRAFVASQNRLTFEGRAPAFRVTNLPSQDVVVYRQQADGRVIKLSGLVFTPGANNTWQVAFRGMSTTATYYVAAVPALGTPEASVARAPANINSGPAELLVIAHPNFIAGLAPWVQARQADYSVKVVDVRDVYATYSGGVFDAGAIAQYVRYAIQNMDTEYIVLVGGDTNDYRNFKTQAISFIPSLYAHTIAYINYAPVDPLYTDVNGDRVPDAAIGRFPVRTAAELELMIDKTLQYDAQGSNPQPAAVFASDEGFNRDSASFAAPLSLNGWSITTAYLGVDASARSTLLSSLNQGARLTSFVGHSGSDGWTFKGLFKSGDARNMTNYDKPTLVTQWGCWNTYYVDPSVDPLGNAFLLTSSSSNPNATIGAAVVTGSTTLTYNTSERALGDLMMPRLVTPGTPVGAAMQAAKVELGRTRPELADVLLGWTVLGDPTVVLRP